VKDDDRNAFRIVRDHCGTQKSFRLHSVVKRHLMQTFAVFRNIFLEAINVKFIQKHAVHL
jgi:hypothetical protein